MRNSFQSVQANYIKSHHSLLLSAKVRADNCDTAGTNLGEGIRLQFLAATGLYSLEDSLNTIKVLYVSKRKMIATIGGLLYVFGCYGVPVSVVPSGINIDVLAYVHGPSLPRFVKDELFEKLGVVKETYDRGDYLHNYLAAKIHVVKSETN